MYDVICAKYRGQFEAPISITLNIATFTDLLNDPIFTQHFIRVDFDDILEPNYYGQIEIDGKKLKMYIKEHCSGIEFNTKTIAN